MEQSKSFIKSFETSIKECWDAPALDEFKVSSLTYGGLAAEMDKYKTLWTKLGLVKGDKIAINAKSSANWITIFMAAECHGFVTVQLFNGFTPSDTQNLVNHSDSKVLYTEKRIWEKMDFTQMPEVLAVYDCNTLELLASRKDTTYEWNKTLTAEDICFEQRDPEEVCAIMYTSGSTGNPKGVMLTIGAFDANVDGTSRKVPFRRGENYLSVLPYAHIFGLTVDAICPLCSGMHTYVLGLPPIPTYIKEALSVTKPHVFFGVPLIFIKFIESVLGEIIHSKAGSAALADAENNADFCAGLRRILINEMGGNIELFCTGGAAIPEQLEQILAFKLKAPFSTGYGLTETCPVISIGTPGQYKAKSCGEPLHNVKVKINSPDPARIPGEVLVKAPSVFKGYYKNPDATAAAFTEDGWFRTGDMGTMDIEGTLFLVGRCKNMLLSSNGQNIYPEEIEVVLNEMPYVAESIVIGNDGRLTALIVPDQAAVDNNNLDASSLESIMQANIEALNAKIPVYSAVNAFELRFEPFAKTPKGSIRRFLYEKK